MNAELIQIVTSTAPEVVVGVGICVVLLTSLFAGRGPVYLLAMLVLLAGAWSSASITPPGTSAVFGGVFVVDPLGRLLKLFAFGIVAAVYAYSRSYLEERRLDAGEFYALGLFALLGILVIISSGSFLVIYLGLETLSLALYAMVAFERDSPIGAEAAMKYFVLGAIASGCLLYGISIIYGVTGTVMFTDVTTSLTMTGSGNIGVLAGLSFILVGIAFKFGAVPFHMWMPDVYQGAPTCTTVFIATASKIAAFALALRILTGSFAPVFADWQAMLAVVAVLSLAIGNLAAIVQRNIKRMLAYSAISHIGFILLGFLAGQPQGVQAALFYTLVYVLMSAAAFGVVMLVGAGRSEADQLDDFKGLNRRSPWFALMMLLVMVSMIGVPPLAGFYAKWWILTSLLDTGHTWLAIIAVLFSVIGAFYYLRVVHFMYFEEGVGGGAVRPASDLRVLLSVNSLLVLGLGVFPARLLDLCANALR